MEISLRKKKQGIYCCAYACSNKPIARKGGLCHKHYRRKIRENDPVQARYNDMRGNAKKRGRKVHFTIDEFRKWCENHGYIVKKGNRGYSATIDRRCNAQDYWLWNMRILSHRHNSSKGAKTNGDDFDCPF